MTVNDDVLVQKQMMRDEMKAQRSAMNEAERARAAWSLCHRLANFLEQRTERTIGVYLARPYEISLDNLIGGLLRDGYEVAAPRVDLATGQMSFWRLENLEDVEVGPWNVREPFPVHPIKELPLVLVPGLAFDRVGGRLGTGGGWYDRTLGEVPVKVGVGFDSQIVARVPVQDHDIPMDFLASQGLLLSLEDSIKRDTSQN
ncbi:MAG TPA: 5-formyltetrahydrofolate cyclo-ligase [Abditibacterium sp.]|jgi:5-formyltetrahydrofolate cyclo-ligase